MSILESMPGVVYLLCAATSLACALLLWRGYRQSRARLLFWSTLCFLGLTVDNLLLYVDRVVVPNFDLDQIRRFPALVALMLLVYGMVIEDE